MAQQEQIGRLTILSQTERLSEVRDFVSAAARNYGFDEESVNKIALAVDEACTNIIKHAYGNASDKRIDVTVTTQNGTFEITIAHNGKSFDPQLVRPPDMREYLTHFRRGGLGLHLMRSLMDGVEYRSLPGQRSEVHLIKRRPSATRP
jgi:serine/threonine-protein kinase RsbW